MSKDTIFLYGYYGCGNAGDELLCRVLIDHLRMLPRVGLIRVKCFSPSPLHEDKLKWVQAECHLADQASSKPLRIWRFCREVWSALADVRALIFGGGTLFHANKGSVVNLLILVTVVIMARLRGAEVFAIGVGVAALCGFLPRALFAVILLLSSDFCVRDKSSLRYAKPLDFSSKVRLTADLVLLLPLPRRSAKKYEPRILGITLAASAEVCKVAHPPCWIKQLVSAMNELHSARIEFRFLSFQNFRYGAAHLFDGNFLDCLRKEGLKAVCDLFEVSDTVEIQKAFEGLTGIIGMRFHSLVVAAKLGIPFIGLGRDLKLADFCREFQFPFFHLDKLQAKELVQAVQCVEKFPISMQRLEKMVYQAEANFTKLNKVFS